MNRLINSKPLRWIAQRPPVILFSALLLIAAVWGFVELTGEVTEGDTRAFDRWSVEVLREPGDPRDPRGPAWIAELARDVTSLGSNVVLMLMTLAVAGYLWIDRNRRIAVYVVVAAVSGIVVSLLLKEIINRPRPDVVPHLAKVFTSSFPSGHSMVSAVVYLTLGAVLAASVRARPLKVYVLSVAIAMSGLVGASRVYLGVHYPTDVLAGWMAGLAWALLCYLVAYRWSRSLKLESDQSPAPVQ